MLPRHRHHKALATSLAIAGVLLVWQGRGALSQGAHLDGDSHGALDRAGHQTAETYHGGADVPAEAPYGWSYPFAFPHDPHVANQKPKG